MNQQLIEQKVNNAIYEVRGYKIMLDSELASLYGVEVKRLNEQVKRNQIRFPKDFMFQLTKEEWNDLKSQDATTSWGGRRSAPYAFTEQGVAMLSSVLNSRQAIQVNIGIMRAFVKMRKWASSYADLLNKIEHLQMEQMEQQDQIEHIYKIIEELSQQTHEERRPIGFKK